MMIKTKIKGKSKRSLIKKGDQCVQNPNTKKFRDQVKKNVFTRDSTGGKSAEADKLFFSFANLLFLFWFSIIFWCCIWCEIMEYTMHFIISSCVIVKTNMNLPFCNLYFYCAIFPWNKLIQTIRQCVSFYCSRRKILSPVKSLVCNLISVS